MEEKGIDYYIVPTADFHQDEYVGEHFKARVFITGFTGSAGTAMIGMDDARLWTDGRYFIQAEKQLKDTTVQLMKMFEPGYPTLTEFLMDHLEEGQTVGFDGRVVSKDEGDAYAAVAEKKHGHIKYDIDLIDEIWKDRPAMSTKPAWLLPVKYAGKSAEEKISDIREKMAGAGADIHVETTPDDICWTINERRRYRLFPSDALIRCYYTR